MKIIRNLIFTLFIFSLSFYVYAVTISPLTGTSAILTTKIAEKITQIKKLTGTVPIFVLPGNDEFIEAAKKGKIGERNVSVSAIASHTDAKDGSILVIQAGNDANIDAIIKFCDSKKATIVCLALDPKYVEKGISIGIGFTSDNIPRIFIFKNKVTNYDGVVGMIGELRGMVVQY